MPIEVYKFLHIISVVILVLNFGLMIGHYKHSKEKNKLYNILHGISLTFILISGFGMLARLSINGSWPLWVQVKFAVWLLMGGVVVLLRKKPCTFTGLISIIVLTGLAVFSAIYHI